MPTTASCRLAVACAAAAFWAYGSLAGDVASRKMAWAHYVGWTTPDNVSFDPRNFYAFLVHEKGEDPFRDEVRRAVGAGLDGFFVDVIFQKDRSRHPAFHETISRLLDAARGTDFCVAPCLDVKTDVSNQVEHLCWLLGRYGGHPNYPRMGDRYVVATFTHHEWSPDEWRSIREGCERRGYPLFVVGNVKAGCGVLEQGRLERYRDSFDVCYSFAYAGRERLQEGDENRANAEWCRKNGKMFMPCIHPGYLGAWLKDHNASYHPHQGVDKYLRSLFSALETGGEWLHFTTWNDLAETALDARVHTPGDVALMREAVAAFKREPPRAEKADVLFAYHREELPGTLLRFEATRLPSAEDGEVVVSGRLRNALGNVVADLPARRLCGGWDRAEWLVPSVSLASSPHLVPEFEMKTPSRDSAASFPALFLRTPWIENQVTVRATFADMAPRMDSALSVSWADGRIAAALSFGGEVPVRRAILFRNDRPIGQFGKPLPDGRARIPVFAESRARYSLSVPGGALCGEAKMEMGGNLYRAVTAEGGADSSLLVSFDDGSSRSIPLSELAARRVVRLPETKTTLKAYPDCTLRDAPGLGATGGMFNLALFDRAPACVDSYFVRFELADGRVGESGVVYPFAPHGRLVWHPVLESSVTLETLPGEEGLPPQPPTVAHSEFLTARDSRPVRGTAVVDAQVSAASFRSELWPLQESGAAAYGERHLAVRPDRFGLGADGRRALSFSGNDAVKLPVREWPMDTADVRLDVLPEAPDGTRRTVVGKRGVGVAFTLAYMADGRLEATWSGMGSGGVWDLKPSHVRSVVSRDPLPVGKWTRVRLVNDSRKLSIWFDGVLEGEAAFEAFRDYGSATMFLGGSGASDGTGFKGMISNLRIGAHICR